MLELMIKIISIIEDYRVKHTDKQVTIAIDGMCGAGKSTVAKMLHERLGGILIWRTMRILCYFCL